MQRVSASLPIEVNTVEETPVVSRSYTLHTETALKAIPRRLNFHEEGMCITRKRAARALDYDPDRLPTDDQTRSIERLAFETRVSSKQGKRNSHEDAELVHETERGTFLAVCDGHGRYSKHQALLGLPQPGLACAQLAARSIREHLLNFIRRCNYVMPLAFSKWAEKAHKDLPEDIVGTTVSGCFIERVNNVLHAFNIGDSGIVVFRKVDGLIFPVPLFEKDDWSVEENAERVKKIYSSQEFAEFQSKPVKEKRFPPIGGVNLASSLGDKKMVYKGQTAISHVPKCSQVQLQPNDLIIIGCDGLFDFVTIDKIIDEVLLAAWDDPDANFAELLTKYALEFKGSTDNVTVIATRVMLASEKLSRQKTVPLEYY